MHCDHRLSSRLMHWFLKWVVYFQIPGNQQHICGSPLQISHGHFNHPLHDSRNMRGHLGCPQRRRSACPRQEQVVEHCKQIRSQMGYAKLLWSTGWEACLHRKATKKWVHILQLQRILLHCLACSCRLPLHSAGHWWLRITKWWWDFQELKHGSCSVEWQSWHANR